MGIQLNSTFAQIGINRTPANQQVTQAKQAVQIKNNMPKVEITSEQIQVQIDQQQQFAESGLKSVFQLTDEDANKAMSVAKQTTERFVSEGNELTNIHTGQDAIADQAERSQNTFNGELNIVSMPRSRPTIEFTGGQVDVEVIEGNPDIKFNIQKATHEYKKSKIDVYMKQKARLDMKYVPEINMKI